MANLELTTLLDRILVVGEAKLERKNISLIQELLIINVCNVAHRLKRRLEAAEEDQMPEEVPSVAPEPQQQQEQEPEQQSQPQIASSEDDDFIPYDEDTDVSYSSSVDGFASDEEFSSLASMGNEYEYSYALYAAIDEDGGHQNQSASSNQNDVPETLDCDDPGYLSSNETHGPGSEYNDLASLTPTALHLNDTIYETSAEKDESSYEFCNTANNTHNHLECTNNVAVVNSLDVSATSITIPSTSISVSTDLISGNSLRTTSSSTPLPTATSNAASVANENKENKPAYSSRLKRKHGCSFDGADMSGNAPKQRKLVETMPVNDPNTIKVNKAQDTTSYPRIGLGSLDNQSAPRINEQSDAASRCIAQASTLQDIENRPVYNINLTTNVQKQPLLVNTGETPCKEVSIVEAAPQPIIQQTTNIVSTAATPKYTTVSFLGKKRTRHERDEYDFYSDYHQSEAKRLFSELLSKDPF